MHCSQHMLPPRLNACFEQSAVLTLVVSSGTCYIVGVSAPVALSRAPGLGVGAMTDGTMSWDEDAAAGEGEGEGDDSAVGDGDAVAVCDGERDALCCPTAAACATQL